MRDNGGGGTGIAGIAAIVIVATMLLLQFATCSTNKARAEQKLINHSDYE